MFDLTLEQPGNQVTNTSGLAQQRWAKTQKTHKVSFDVWLRFRTFFYVWPGGLQRKEWNVNKYKIFILYADDTVRVNLIYHIEVPKNTPQQWIYGACWVIWLLVI